MNTFLWGLNPIFAIIPKWAALYLTDWTFSILQINISHAIHELLLYYGLGEYIILIGWRVSINFW